MVPLRRYPAPAPPRVVRRPHLLRGPRQAFSLVELLVAVVAGVLLVSAFSYAVTSHLRSSQIQERAQRSRDDATRLNALIQTEASEAVTTTQGETIAACDPAANGRTALFSLTVPRPTAQFDDLGNVARIHYYNLGNGGISDLRRCGPAILRNGSLDFSRNVDGIVSANTVASLVACPSGGPQSSSREVVYQLQLNDSPGGYRPPCAIARARAFRVIDP